MNNYKLQQLNEQRKEIRELLSLFERAAFRPDDGNNGGDPTAALNGVFETRIALQTRGAALIQDNNAARFFRNLQDQLLEIENKVQRKYPKVMDLAIEYWGKPINTVDRIASIRQKLGKIYTKAAIFIRAEAYSVYDSPEKARTVLASLNKKVDQLINGEDKITQKTGILFLAADPTDASRLQLDEEFRKIDQQLRLSKDRDLFKLELPQLALRPEDISGALLNFQPKIVHFSGHGTPEGALCFTNETGQTHLVQPEALAALFKQFAKKVKCIVLNACYSQSQASAIGKHIHYIVGMHSTISDNAALAFTTGFYQALGAGCTIKKAYTLGCNQIGLQGTHKSLTSGMGRGIDTGHQESPGISESLTPVLIIKGQLWQ